MSRCMASKFYYFIIRGRNFSGTGSSTGKKLQTTGHPGTGRKKERYFNKPACPVEPLAFPTQMVYNTIDKVCAPNRCCTPDPTARRYASVGFYSEYFLASRRTDFHGVFRKAQSNQMIASLWKICTKYSRNCI